MNNPRQAAIVGIYMTEQGKLTERTAGSVYAESVLGALSDAGLGVKDIDGIIGTGPEGAGIAGDFSDNFGVTLRFQAQTGVGASSSSSGIGIAAMAIEKGYADVVIIPTASGGAVRPGSRGGGGGPTPSPFEHIWGSNPAAIYAMAARRHMYEYGTTPEQLAEIAVAARRHATLNPASVMGERGLISIEDVMGSRMIADPLHLFDCCLVNAGGGAIVMTTMDRAASLRTKPIVLMGWGEGFTFHDIMTAPSMTSFGGVTAANTAFGQAGLSRDNIDVAGISDHFSINVLIELEDAGFCNKGEGGDFIAGGGIQLGGRLPVNTDGGFLSSSHGGGCGLYTVVELVRQLRGEAGERQVENCDLAYAHGTGGTFQGQYAAIFARG
jgi:acetyl-CoA acetyltransferase